MAQALSESYLQQILDSSNPIDFSRVNVDDFQPTIESYLDRIQEVSRTISAKGDSVSFDDVFLPLEQLEAELNTLVSLFYIFLSNGLKPELVEASSAFFATLSEINNDMMLDAALFKGIKTVYLKFENDPSVPHTKKRQVKLYYQDFQRNGATLNDADKQKLRQIDVELSGLGPQFDQNVLQATEAFSLDVTDKSILTDLSESQLEYARAQAADAGVENAWRFTLNNASFIPFMKHVPDSDLRKKMSVAWENLCYKDANFDNTELIPRIVRLRQERSQLLGFKSFAHYTLQDRMLNSPEKVDEFLQNLLTRLEPAARHLHDTLADFAPEFVEDGKLNSWDRGFLLERYRKSTIDLDEKEIRPYFELDATLNNMFKFVSETFGVQASPCDIPLPHATVRTYRVDDESGSLLGYLYLDLFERKGKQQGAWCSSLRPQHKMTGIDVRPHVYLTCNFQAPQGDTPVLLSFLEAETVFHEFGHALHNFCSMCEFPSLSGTSVSLDFVELPSQLMENFLMEPESLKYIARHFQTGAEMPADLINKIRKNRVIDAAHGRLFESLYSIIDQRWHTPEALNEQDPVKFEAEIMRGFDIWRRVPNANLSCSFSHIFTAGYAAGFYSYMWSKVLDAHAFEVFKNNGVVDKATARKFRDEILARGNEEDPEILFHNFSGSQPDVTALLRREGLLEATPQ